MHVWDTLVASATEADLVRLGSALDAGWRTPVQVLQGLLRESPRRALGDLLPHVADDTLKLACERAGLRAPGSAEHARQLLLESAGIPAEPDWIAVEAPRRKPRLAWQGMHGKPAITSVPTQVLEVVSPGLAEKRDDRQGQLDGVRVAKARTAPAAPVNRLIWTNDNLVALRTLLDERDPETRDYRYRGKVDLIYIDPPFMVNGDFVADNSISIDVDEGPEAVTAVKEPSLVEILAYKDTWREGLDSFLSMIRARLVLLKDLLAPTGSIYVHLDWHAAHYVKVLMDEVFGYERFRNQVIWYYYNKYQGNVNRFPSNHDTILSYGGPGNVYFQPIKEAREKPVQQLVRAWDPEKKALVNAKGADGKVQYQMTSERGVDDVWRIPMLQPADQTENLGYPTQKRREVVERIISASCPPGGLVLDCFVGSGTTAEAAERLGRRWIGIDNGKYAVHLARKRLIQLHGQPRPPEKEQYDYVECEHCSNIERKPRKVKSPGRFEVRPFSLESMGVYQSGAAWLDALGNDGGWRAEMVKVYGGEPVEGFALLHGRKGGEWIHVGPLDAPVPVHQAWSIAQEAADTETRAVTVLTAELVTQPHPEYESIARETGVRLGMKIIPRTAIEQVALRLKGTRGRDGALESMAVPAFYAPLAVSLRARVDGNRVTLALERCEVDVQSFLASQRPALKQVTDRMTAAQRKKAEAEADRWRARQEVLEAWLARATTWQQFVDFWAVDWSYTDHVAPDGRPIFDTDWQSFRTRASKGRSDALVFEAETRYERPGTYQIAARVTDVFGNDGISVVTVEVGR